MILSINSHLNTFYTKIIVDNVGVNNLFDEGYFSGLHTSLQKYYGKEVVQKVAVLPKRKFGFAVIDKKDADTDKKMSISKIIWLAISLIFGTFFGTIYKLI